MRYAAPVMGVDHLTREKAWGAIDHLGHALTKKVRYELAGF